MKAKGYSKSLIKTVLFIAVSVFLLIFISDNYFNDYQSLNYKTVYNSSYSYLLEKENTIDIAFTGSSGVKRAISEEDIFKTTGYTSVITSKTYCTTSQNYVITKQLLESQHPKILFIEAEMLYHNSSDYSEDSEEPTSLSVFLSNFDDKGFDEFVKSKITVFKYNDKFKMLGMKGINDVNSKEFEFHNDNVVTDIVPAENYEGMKFSDNIQYLSAQDLLYLDKTVKLCKDNDIVPIIVKLPQLSWNYYKHNGVQFYADKNGVEFIDFNLMFDELSFDPLTDFYDSTGGHCNVYGQKKISNYLSNYLKDNYSNILTDRRNDKEFKNWY